MSKGHQTFHKGLKTKTTVLSKSAVFFFPVIRLGGMFAPCISGFSHGNEGGRAREGGPQGMATQGTPPRQPRARSPTWGAESGVRVSLLPLHFHAIKIVRAD